MEAILKMGETGSVVAELQRLLRNVGCYSTDEVGTFGASTEAAVRRFQELGGLHPDGVVTGDIWTRLLGLGSHDVSSCHGGGELGSDALHELIISESASARTQRQEMREADRIPLPTSSRTPPLSTLLRNSRQG